ncbi:MAG: amino acid adenylation domain-containing protein, partial [Candidatus Aminicenantes bacterium]
IQYKDFSAWQNKQLEEEGLNNHREYWLGQFKGEVPVLELPCDYPRPKVKTYNGDSVGFLLPSTLSREVLELSQSQGTSLFIVLLASVKSLLYRYTGQEDIVIGSPISGRQHRDLEDQVGFYVNTLALRTVFAGSDSFKGLLGKVKETSLAAYDHELYPFDQLVDDLELARDTSRSPLFDVMVALNSEIGGSPAEGMKGVTVEGYEVDSKISKFDLRFAFDELSEGIYVMLRYNTDLFSRTRIQRMARHYRQLLYSTVNNSQVSLSELNYLSDEEKHRLLYEFNDTKADYPADKTIHELFEEQVERTPHHAAVVAEGEGTGLKPGRQHPHHQATRDGLSMTYAGLNKRCNQLAQVLRDKNVDSDGIVAIMTEPTIEMIVGIMAVLKSGACYLPIDPVNPEERINYLLTDSETKLLLTQAHLVDKVPFEGEILNIEDKHLYKYNGEVSRAAKTGRPGDPVYMIYTSGTTGKPKGVLLKHENLVNYVTWFSTATRLTGEDKTLLTSSFAFDLGYTSIYPSLLKGGQLHILPKEVYMLPGSLLEYILRQGITYLKMTPSLFSTIVADPSFSGETCCLLRLVVLGGEAINTADVEKAYRICGHLRIMNHYGPTEVTIGCIAQFIDIDDLETYKSRPTIGSPISNTKVFILDKYLNLLPEGIAGELCLSGAGVAKGYFKGDALTAEKFIVNSFAFMEGEEIAPPYNRIYRTGDLARWLEDGSIEFLGRIDHQVKIRGYRIELGEIESRLLEHKEIKDAAVLIRNNASSNKYLCAYIVPRWVGSSGFPGTSELKEYLSLWLPDYMVPGYFVRLETLPLTPNGKLDRKALPQPEISISEGYTGPSHPIEKKLVEIWSEVLEIEKEKLGINTNFFELGGHSLRAVIMISKVHKELNVKIPLAEIFRTSTIVGLAEYIKKSSGNRYTYTSLEAVEKKEYYALSSAQKRLYILYRMDPLGTAYNMPRVIPLGAVPDKEKLERVIKKLISRHESLRTSFHLLGEEPVQKIHDVEDVDFKLEKLEYYDLATDEENYKLQMTTKKETGTHHSSKNRIIHHSFVRPFDLSQAPLLRVGMIKTGESQHILLVDTYHIIYDGFSNGVLVKDFMGLDRDEALPLLRLQYKDFSEWQNGEREKENLAQQETYWLKEFGIEGEIPVLNMPIDYVRPAVQSFEGDT